MKLIKSEKLKSGDVLAEDIIRMKGKSILINYDKGTKLNTEKINNIQNLGFDFIYIKDENFTEVQKIDIISIELRERLLMNLKKIFNKIKNNEKVERQDFSFFYKIIDDLVYEFYYNVEYVFPIVSLRKGYKYLVDHSINTTIIAIGIGKKLDIKVKELRKLAFATLFHDVGMLFIDSSLYEKKSDLNKEELNEVKKHTEKGFDFFKNYELYDTGAMAGYVALKHHERWDGSGYPEKDKGDDINIHAQICGLADYYVALTSKRPYRESKSRKSAIKKYIETSSKFYDTLKDAFMDSIILYPNGSIVKLNTREKAVVVKQNENPYKPVVKMINKFGKEGKKLDLQNNELVFKKIIDCNV